MHECHWKVYLDTEDAIENAIRYVEENPSRERQRPRKWEFVTPYSGIPKGGWTTYY